MANSPEKIIIDLSKAYNDEPLEPEDLIHCHELKHTRERIIEVFENPKQNCNNNVFLIDGERGSGKTTFMRALIKNLNHSSNEKPKLNFYHLITIDPTIINKGDYIIFAVIATIKQEIEKSNNFCFNRKQNQYEEWRKQYKKLANGLSLANKNEDKKFDFDILNELDHNVQNAYNLLELHSNLNEFIELSLKLLEADVFIVGLDDMDTNHQLGWDVLETIRKYLRQDKILVLLVANLDSYKQIISEKLKIEQNSIALNQYILKLIGSHHTKLSSLYSLASRVHIIKKKELVLKPHIIMNKNIYPDIPNLIKDLSKKISTAITTDGSYSENILRHFLNQPLRFILMLYKYENEGTNFLDALAKLFTINLDNINLISALELEIDYISNNHSVKTLSIDPHHIIYEGLINKYFREHPIQCLHYLIRVVFLSKIIDSFDVLDKKSHIINYYLRQRQIILKYRHGWLQIKKTNYNYFLLIGPIDQNPAIYNILLDPNNDYFDSDDYLAYLASSTHSYHVISSYAQALEEHLESNPYKGHNDYLSSGAYENYLASGAYTHPNSDNYKNYFNSDKYKNHLNSDISKIYLKSDLHKEFLTSDSFKEYLKSNTHRTYKQIIEYTLIEIDDKKYISFYNILLLIDHHLTQLESNDKLNKKHSTPINNQTALDKAIDTWKEKSGKAIDTWKEKPIPAKPVKRHENIKIIINFYKTINKFEEILSIDNFFEIKEKDIIYNAIYKQILDIDNETGLKKNTELTLSDIIIYFPYWIPFINLERSPPNDGLFSHIGGPLTYRDLFKNFYGYDIISEFQ